MENAVNNGYDVIITNNCKNTPAEIFYTATLISGAIYKKSNITNTVVQNMYDNIMYLFPHLAITAKNINENKKIAIVSKSIVEIGKNPEINQYVRGCKKNEMTDQRRNMFWAVGYFHSVDLITDRKKQIEIIDGLRHNQKSLEDLFRIKILVNKKMYNNYFYNLVTMFKIMSFKQRLKFILIYLQVTLTNKYKFWNITKEEEWIEYLKKVKEQKYINKLANLLKNKEVLLYGAGMFADIIIKNYDLSKINVVGISDIRFEQTKEKEFLGYKTVLPSEINNLNFDCILFTLKQHKILQKILKEKGIDKESYSIIKESSKYNLGM